MDRSIGAWSGSPSLQNNTERNKAKVSEPLNGVTFICSFLLGPHMRRKKTKGDKGEKREITTRVKNVLLSKFAVVIDRKLGRALCKHMALLF
jgi:hypothetical protein